ncbi:MAG: DMT family transporter [Sciscionella sp.]
MTSAGSLARMVALALMWGSSFVWIKLALHGLSPLQITLGRVLLGAAVLVVLCLAGRHRLPGDGATWLAVAVPVLFGSVLPFSLFGVGERTVDSATAGVLNSTTPLWTLLIAVLIWQERGIGVPRLAGLLLGFLGTLVIFAPWRGTGLAGWGALACLAAAASYGVSYTYIGARLSGRIAPIVLTAMQLLGAAVLSAALLPVLGRGAVELRPGVLAAVGVLGVFGTGIAFALMNRLIADDGPTAAASVGYLLPVVSVLLGAVALGEQLNLRIIAGMVVVLIGVALSRRRTKPEPTHRLKVALLRRSPLKVACVRRSPLKATFSGKGYTRRRSEAQRESS